MSPKDDIPNSNGVLPGRESLGQPMGRAAPWWLKVGSSGRMNSDEIATSRPASIIGD